MFGRIKPSATTEEANAVDATFKVMNHPFKQLFGIHAFVKKDGHTKQLPLVFCLMSRRKKDDYVAVFDAVKSLLLQRNIRRIVLDFERATWQAIREVLPGVHENECAFHFQQSVYRHIQDLGLQCQYTGELGHRLFFKKLMALCYLPACHILTAFAKLQESYLSRTQATKKIQLGNSWTTWKARGYSSIWPPTAWSVYGMAIRTNNDVEGWHHRLNKITRPAMNVPPGYSASSRGGICRNSSGIGFTKEIEKGAKKEIAHDPEANF